MTGCFSSWRGPIICYPNQELVWQFLTHDSKSILTLIIRFCSVILSTRFMFQREFQFLCWPWYPVGQTSIAQMNSLVTHYLQCRLVGRDSEHNYGSAVQPQKIFWNRWSKCNKAKNRMIIRTLSSLKDNVREIFRDESDENDKSGFSEERRGSELESIAWITYAGSSLSSSTFCRGGKLDCRLLSG